VLELTDHAGLEAGERDDLAAALAGLTTLADVIRWGLELPEMSAVIDVVGQDEFTNDVILPWVSGRFLVFDTT